MDAVNMNHAKDCIEAIEIKAMPKENLFKPTMTDLMFALVSFILGYLCVRWFLLSGRGWGVTVFTVLYILGVSAYLIKKSVFVHQAATYFWMSVTLLTGFSFALWNNVGFSFIRGLFLFCAAIYFVLVATNTTILKMSSNYLLLDGINAMLILPFRNFINQYVSLSVLIKKDHARKSFPVLVGIVIAIILLIIVVPLLETADAGGFGMITGFFREHLRFNSFDQIIYMIITIPVAAYLYGLVSGAAHKKGLDIINIEDAQKNVRALRFASPTTIYIVLGAVCVVYLVFVLSQIPYFFSAFTGSTPDGWLSYAEFARQGFFELVWIASINLVLLLISNILSKSPRIQAPVLKIFNIVLAVITLLLIATAFSKMALYISTFGLTMRRLLPCLFMVFLLFVFAAIIAMQKWHFSIMRFALIVGAIMITGMSLANPDAMVVRYNANRYIAGTLQDFDVEIVRRAGAAGVAPAMTVFRHTDNTQLRADLAREFSFQDVGHNPSYRITLEMRRASRLLTENNFHRITPSPWR